jgi:hypothetical protein
MPLRHRYLRRLGHPILIPWIKGESPYAPKSGMVEAEEQRSRGAEEQRSRGAEEQRSRGAVEHAEGGYVAGREGCQCIRH